MESGAASHLLKARGVDTLGAFPICNLREKFPMSRPRTMRPLTEIIDQLGLERHWVEPFGWHAGKFALDMHRQLQDRPMGKLIGVTAINPTPFGEGKTVTTIGLAMGMQKLGLRSIANLREPSLAPVFGIKGGGAGGGAAQLEPMEDINLHFTGDLHAITAANNLVAAMLDNHCKRQLSPSLDPQGILTRRVIDMNDKGLHHIEVGIDEPIQAPRYHTGFDLTAASEVMSIVSMATDFADLRKRLGAMVVGITQDDTYLTAEELGAAGAMAALLRNAIRPNLVQTSEGTPAIVHAGPFANISHGNNSVIADLTALRLADYVVTESGFGSDNGAVKLFDLKCRVGGYWPHVEVLVCTVKALKYHSGRFEVKPGFPIPPAMLEENLTALEEGIANLAGHLHNLRQFNVPVVVAINRFPTDTDAEIALLTRLSYELGAERVATSDAFARGGEGAIELAEAVVEAAKQPVKPMELYPLDASYATKLNTIARCVYGGDGVDWMPGVEEKLAGFVRRGYAKLPVCIAKTQYSLSHQAKLLGRPSGFRVPIADVRLTAGAGYVLAMTEGISLMPGLPKNSSAKKIDVSADGQITGMS